MAIKEKDKNARANYRITHTQTQKAAPAQGQPLFSFPNLRLFSEFIPEAPDAPRNHAAPKPATPTPPARICSAPWNSVPPDR